MSNMWGFIYRGERDGGEGGGRGRGEREGGEGGGEGGEGGGTHPHLECVVPPPPLPLEELLFISGGNETPI